MTITYTEFKAEAERVLNRSLRGREIALWYKLWRAKYYIEPAPSPGSALPPMSGLRDWLQSGGGGPPSVSRIPTAKHVRDDPTQREALSPEMKSNLNRVYESACRVSIIRVLKWLRTVHGLDVDHATDVILGRRVEEVS